MISGNGNLAEARAVRSAIADGNPPEGWPTVTSLGAENEGKPVPKCSIIDCPEPGIFRVAFVALTIEFCGTNMFACEEHLDHFALSGADWVRK